MFLRIFIVIFVLISYNCVSKQFISNIFIDREQVFDSTSYNPFGINDIANSLHILTKQYIIEDELLFSEDDELDDNLLYETERNLRSTNLFSKVSIEIDSLSPYYFDVYVTTHDRWTTIPIIIFGTGGNTTNIGTGIEELNLLGTGTHVRVEGYHRSENDIGWQGGFSIYQRRLFRSEIGLNFQITANKYRTDQLLTVSKNFRALSTKWSYGVSGLNSYGRDFLYEGSDDYNLMNFHNRKIQGWLSRAWLRNDRVFITGFLELDDVNRGDTRFRRAFDNSGKILVSFSSVSEDYDSESNLNSYQIEDLPIGGWGIATLGKIFPITNDGDNLYYVAGQGEKSYKIGDFYTFAQITGASAFSQARGKYTYEEIKTKLFYKFKNNLLIANRIRQQSVWNWDALRQLILDNDGGLRGYEANELTGDNRMIVNTELRYYPDWEIWAFNLSPVAFWDLGSVWNQDTEIFDAKWYNSAGLGIRFFNTKGHGEDSIFRLDFAFNFNKMGFGGIIFTTNQLFSIFSKHQYKLPSLYGMEFDYQ